MVLSGIACLKQFFSVPDADENPELLKAQLEVFFRHIPIMYPLLLISTWTIAILGQDVAPSWLVTYIPIAFSLISILRIIAWYRNRHRVLSAEQAHTLLKRTNRMAAIMAVTTGAWSMTLYQYGDYFLRMNVAFFMATAGVGVIVCLLHMRSAAFAVGIIANIPFLTQLSASGDPSLVSMSIEMILGSSALLMVVFVQSRHFTTSVNARTSLEAINKENSDLANLDSLTGLANRRRFFSVLEAACEQAKEGEKLAVGIIDLDGFKPINDLYGHSVGDDLLRETSRRLLQVAGQGILVARLGGDEFALLIRDECENGQLQLLGERLCSALNVPFIISDVTAQISGSIGFAVFPQVAQSAPSLYERADYALYHGKRTAPGQATLFSNEQAIAIEKDARIEQVMRSADLEAELDLYFQPIMDIRQSSPVAFEALARWKSPRLGNVPPSSFIPIAERTGDIRKMTRLLLKKALVEACEWPERIRLSFNLSNHDIGTPEGTVAIMNIIKDSGFDPRRIDFEITETSVMCNYAQSENAIEMLKALGCGIALDDFGTGFSSLSHLHALPLTKIKIDRSFISDIDKKPASYKIVKSLLGLSRDMGLCCVLEGIETQEELAVVKKLGGRLIQGFFFSPPMPAYEVEDFLSDANVGKYQTAMSGAYCLEKRIA